jgi:hypothetical protein
VRAVIVGSMEPSREQLAVCERFRVTPATPAKGSRLGAAWNVRDGSDWPLNGLRHPPEQGTNGWYLWRGVTLSQADDFFQPLHTEHLADWSPEVLPYLALPPGWRFLLAPGCEDVWYDASLLDV